LKLARKEAELRELREQPGRRPPDLKRGTSECLKVNIKIEKGKRGGHSVGLVRQHNKSVHSLLARDVM
jgi:hypothetical protein